MEEKGVLDAKVEVFEPLVPAYYADEEKERPTCGLRSRLKRWGKWTWESNYGMAATFAVMFMICYGLWMGFMMAWLQTDSELYRCRRDEVPFFADMQLSSVRIYMKTLPQTPEVAKVDEFITNMIMGHLKTAIPEDQVPLQQLNELMLEKQSKTVEETVKGLREKIDGYIKAQHIVSTNDDKGPINTVYKDLDTQRS